MNQLVFSRNLNVGGEPVTAGTPVERFRRGRAWITDAWIAEALACGHLQQQLTPPPEAPAPAAATEPATEEPTPKRRRGRS